MRTHEMRRDEQVSTIGHNRALRLIDQRPLQVQVVSGTAYLTREGDDRDYVLESGEVISFREKGQIVVQGMPFAAYRIMAQ